MSIRAVNLDGMFLPTPLSEIEFKIVKFKGGELHPKLNMNIDYTKIERVVITNRFNDAEDIMEVLVVKDALERLGIKHFDLIMPYIPYARQDRFENAGESFTLKVFANLINTAKFDTIHVFDSHSDVAPALIDNCVNKKNHAYVMSSLIDIIIDNPETIIPYTNSHPTSIASIKNTIRSGHYALIAPDSGANKKINKLHDYINESTIDPILRDMGLFTLPIIKCDKRRNTDDGSLGGFEVMSADLEGRICIIVDDICSRGGTFMGLAKELKAKNAGDIYLVVSHYENCANENELNDAGIKCVYKTNSMNDHSSDFIKNTKLEF
jgi:ribose-phosphate pyrophosphokinase